MARRYRLRLLLIMTITVLLLACCTLVSFAATPVREGDVTEASEGNTLVYLKGEFKVVSKDTILAEFNRIRLEACLEGDVPDPRDTTRMLAPEDYVPLRWSSELEWIAQTRAAEASMTMQHDRPNGTRCFTCDHDGFKAKAEILAWNNINDTMRGIEQWYEKEKYGWLVQDETMEIGHYKQMINPANKYLGLATFDPPSSLGCIAGEFSRLDDLDESQIGVRGTYRQVIEVANDNLRRSYDMPKWLHVGRTYNADVDFYTVFTTGKRDVYMEVSPVGGKEWSSDDVSIATINSSGKIRGISEGDVKIFMSYGDKKYSCTVRVRNHLWRGSYTVDRPASSTRDGVKSIHCSVCGAKKKGSEVRIPKFTMPGTYITKVTKGRRSLTVKWKRCSGITGYEIQCSTKKSFRKFIKKTAKARRHSKKISRLRRKKKYYVRIRTYKIMDGYKYYSSWSKWKALHTK